QEAQGGTHEKLEANKPSHTLFAGPHGNDSREAGMANEGRLRRSVQLSFILSLLLQQARRDAALRVQHGGEGARRTLGRYQPGGSKVLADRRSGRRVGHQQKGSVGGGIV